MLENNKNIVYYSIQWALGISVTHLICNEERRVRLPQGPHYTILNTFIITFLAPAV